MEKVDVLILVEHINRELDTAISLKSILEKEKYKVKIKSVFDMKEKLIQEIDPRVLILPWGHYINFFKYYGYKNNNIPTILSLSSEQLTNAVQECYLIPKDETKDICHLSWGKLHTERLIKNGCQSEKIFELGNPRLDFLEKKYLKLYRTKKEIAKEFKLSIDKKWVLFLDNGYRYLSEKELKNIDKVGVDLRPVKLESDKADIIIFEWIEKFLKQNPQVEFILRPHPSYGEQENDIFKELKLKYTNFNVIFKYSAGNWLKVVDICNSFISTTFIESLKCKVNYNLIRPFKLPKELDIDLLSIFNPVTSYEEFEKSNTLINNLDLEVKRNIVNKFVKIKEKEVIEKLSEKIIEIINDEEKYKVKFQRNKKEYLSILLRMNMKVLLKKGLNLLPKNLKKQVKDKRFSHLFNDYYENFTEKDILKREKIINEIKKG